jgi:hypothetical protein
MALEVTPPPIVEVANAALRRESLLLRSLVQDLLHNSTALNTIPRPATDDLLTLAVSAAILELLAARTGQASPSWTAEIGALPEPFYLVEAAQRMPRLRRLCETESPEPLRKRGLYAPPDFLTFA